MLSLPTGETSAEASENSSDPSLSYSSESGLTEWLNVYSEINEFLASFAIPNDVPQTWPVCDLSSDCPAPSLPCLHKNYSVNNRVLTLVVLPGNSDLVIEIMLSGALLSTR